MAPAGRPILVHQKMLLLTGMVALAVLPLPQGPAAASCAAPYLQIDQRQVLERRGAVDVDGRAFTDGGCQDAMECSTGLGCDSCEYVDPPPTPMRDVSLRLVQGGRTWLLDVADAQGADRDHLGWVTWSFRLPAGVDAGPARLRADHAPPVTVQVR